MDKIAAAESIFGERVVHGYFLISAAAGLFVDAGVGPVIANYGITSCGSGEPWPVDSTEDASFSI